MVDLSTYIVVRHTRVDKLRLERHHDGCINSGFCATCGVGFDNDPKKIHYEDVDFDARHVESENFVEAKKFGGYYCPTCAKKYAGADYEAVATLRALRG